ncbi:MAG: hypothetical protein IJU65_00430 [Desulfovibrio sp.]|nr:hypothetical protein [Desulfovibrio sp.]
MTKTEAKIVGQEDAGAEAVISSHEGAVQNVLERLFLVTLHTFYTVRIVYVA